MRKPRFLHHIMHRVGVNDCFLAVLLLYLMIDLRQHSEAFHSCSRPIHMWLLGTYALVALLRAASLVSGACDSEEFDCLLPRGRLGNLTWPVLAVWTIVGTVWTSSGRAASELCLAEPRHLFLVVSLIVASYAWLIFHAVVGCIAWQHNRHLEWIKHNFREVEDEDMISRWGNVSGQPVEASLSHGLTAAEIAALPSRTATPSLIAQAQDRDCPICLCSLRLGDSVRPLDACGHTFHRACIDLWLLRRAECPLCKTCVGSKANVSQRLASAWAV